MLEAANGACDAAGMTAKTIEQLQLDIERLIREHLAGERAAVAAAVERAFGATTTPKPKPTPSAAPGRQTWGRRRPPHEIAGIAERLFEAVRANPGETMEAIAPMLGESARALNQPMINLKRAGRIRSAGQRHLTRYFPMTSRS